MTAPLPNRRLSETIRFDIGGQHFYGTVGYAHEFKDGALILGEPREVFLDAGKPGSDLQAACRDFAVVVSKALEYGTPLEELRTAITRLDDGKAAGPGGRLLDAIARLAP